MIDGGHIQEEVAARALGALSPEEQTQVDRHVADCPSCNEKLREAEEAAAMLALAVRPVRPPSRCKSRVMARIEEEQRPSRGAMRNWMPALLGAPTAAQGMQARRAVWPMRTMVGLTVLALLVWNVQLQRRLGETTMVQSMVIADHQPSALEPQGPASGRAYGRMFMNADGNDAVLVIENLEPPPPGKVYQIWVANEQSHRPMQTFRPGQPIAQVIMHASEPLHKFKWVMITLEDEGGSAEPSETTVLFGDL